MKGQGTGEGELKWNGMKGLLGGRSRLAEAELAEENLSKQEWDEGIIRGQEPAGRGRNWQKRT
jgi:hypothetical protein